MSFADIIKENLSLWHEATAANRELCLLALNEAAKEAAIAWQAGRVQDPAAWRIAPPALPASSLVPPADSFAEMLALDEQLAFCRMLLALCPRFPHEDEESEVSFPVPTAPRVAMLSGDFFINALHGFASVIPHAIPTRTHSFSAALEEIALGNADFAILPTEDERGGRRLSLVEECDRLELHINCVTDIPSPHGGRHVQFALISRSPAPLLSSDGKQMLECRLFSEDSFALSDFLTAATACGLSLFRVDSLPDPYVENAFAHHAVLAVNQGDVALLEAYMALRLPRSFVTGHYLYL